MERAAILDLIDEKWATQRGFPSRKAAGQTAVRIPLLAK